jgi:hypothetical protein
MAFFGFIKARERPQRREDRENENGEGDHMYRTTKIHIEQKRRGKTSKHKG